MIGKGKKASANFDVLKLSLFFLVMCIPLSGGADAASVSTNLNVSASVVPVCQVTATPVNFGNYAGTDVYASGDVSVNCASGTQYHIALDAGLYYDGFWRTVSSGTNAIRYGFFKNPCQSSEWGDSDYADTYIWGSSLADNGNGMWQPHTVYGRLYRGPAVPPGSYSDIATVTIHF